MISQDDILTELTRIFREAFREPALVLTPASTPETIGGWDSFKYISVIVAVESLYAIELDGPELDQVQNIGELATLIQNKQEEPTFPPSS